MARKLTNFFNDPDLAEGLKRLKAIEQSSEGHIIRAALREYLDQRGVLKKKAASRRAQTRRKA